MNWPRSVLCPLFAIYLPVKASFTIGLMSHLERWGERSSTSLRRPPPFVSQPRWSRGSPLQPWETGSLAPWTEGWNRETATMPAAGRRRPLQPWMYLPLNVSDQLEHNLHSSSPSVIAATWGGCSSPPHGSISVSCYAKPGPVTSTRPASGSPRFNPPTYASMIHTLWWGIGQAWGPHPPPPRPPSCRARPEARCSRPRGFSVELFVLTWEAESFIFFRAWVCQDFLLPFAVNDKTACDHVSGLMSALHTASDKYLKRWIHILKVTQWKRKYLLKKTNVFLPHCVYIFHLFTLTLQLRSLLFLKCLKKKKMEENNFFLLVLFLSDGIVLYLCCCWEVYCLSLLCTWPVVLWVNCPVETLYTCPRPHLSSDTNALFFFFQDKKRKRQRRWRDWNWGEGLQSKILHSGATSPQSES